MNPVVHKPQAPHDNRLDIDPEWTARILSNFIRREVQRTGLSRVVVGLSGGIDSAVSTYLAARALGSENVFPVMLPYRTSSATSLSDAQQIVDDLDLPAETVDITPMVDGFVGATPEVTPHRLGNVMARVRMLVLYDRSALHHGLVLGTSNKTELLLGYGTLFGDLSSALNPIGDLYKTQVRALAAHLGVPQAIQTKPPSADLIPDQTDEDDLGFEYATVDPVLALLVDARLSAAEIAQRGHPRQVIDRAVKMIERSQFKRRLPLIAKVSLRSIGWDFRYPRDWKT